jgi:hypothetical protein
VTNATDQKIGIGFGSAFGAIALVGGVLFSACGGVTYGYAASHPLQAEGKLISGSAEFLGLLSLGLGLLLLVVGGVIVTLTIVLGRRKVTRSAGG